jgi:hypothetical protein
MAEKTEQEISRTVEQVKEESRGDILLGFHAALSCGPLFT